MTSASLSLFERAKNVIPGGVNSPVRAFNGVGGEPVFFERGEGPYLIDADGKRYIDYVGSWGPLILGHCAPSVLQAVQQTVEKGLSFGAPTALEVELAELICERFASIDKVRMVNSGTEATMTAVRLARGYTDRPMIVKFIGCYHGHSDSLLVKAGSGVLTLGIPSTPGIPQSITQHTLNLPFNDPQALEDAFAQYGDQIAGVILEPVAGNMNCIPPSMEFLTTLRRLCDNAGSVLIFDEVMTGFRLSASGAQGYYNITPDLTTLGKVVGGGMPVGALGGKRAIMDYLAPVGPVYQAGTLSGNPVTMAAGLATLKALQAPEVYPTLTQRTEKLMLGLQSAAESAGIALCCQFVPSMFGFFFTDAKRISTFDEVSRCDVERFKRFFHGMLAEGVYLAPSAFEAGFLSLAHDDAVIDETIAAAERVFQQLS